MTPVRSRRRSMAAAIKAALEGGRHQLVFDAEGGCRILPCEPGLAQAGGREAQYDAEIEELIGAGGRS